MQNDWKEINTFAAYQSSYNVLSPETRKKKDMQRNYFFELMQLQIRKHNGHYLRGTLLLRSVFGEQQTGVLFAKLIEVQDPTLDQLELYFSNIRNATIDLNHLFSF